MFPINPLLLYKILGVLLFTLFVVAFSVYLTASYDRGQYAKEKLELIAKQAQALKEATDRVRANELKIANLQTQLEGSYEKENARVNEVLLHYTGLINDGFRLRDNSRVTSRPVPSIAATGTSDSSNSATCSNELSAEATKFLLGFATDADKVVNQLVTCQQYATEIRNTCSVNK